MLNPYTLKELAQALKNAARMTPKERSKRIQMVKLSGRIYHAGMALWRKAEEVDHPEATEARSFLAETQALDIDRVWEPDEAKQLLTDIQDRSIRLGEIARDDDAQV